MRFPLALILGVAITGSAMAQPTGNVLRLWDRITEYTSRGALSGSAGKLSQGFPHGITGDSLQSLRQTLYNIQDQDLATQEPWDVGLTVLDARGLPDYPNFTPYATGMVNPVSSGIGVYTWRHTPTTPIPLPKTLEQWHHVWNFKTTTNWATDGIGVHMSQAAPSMPVATCNGLTTCCSGYHRECPRTDGTANAQIIEELGWSDQSGNPTLPNFQDRAWYVEFGFNDPVLQGGAKNATYNCAGVNDPNQGYAAIDPDFSDVGSGSPARFDDYTWTVLDYQAQAAAILLSMTVFPNGGVPTPLGQLHLNLADPLLAFGAIPVPLTGGVGTANFVLGPGTSPLRPIMTDLGSMTAQAVVLRGSRPFLSNPWTFRTKLLPTGFTAGTADGPTATQIPRTPGPLKSILLLRNDGRGTLTLQPTIGTTKVGPATVVAERTMVQIIIPVAANNLDINSNKTAPGTYTPTRFAYRFLN